MKARLDCNSVVKGLQWTGLWVAAVLLAGCSTSVAVKQSFPQPVMQQLPFAIGLYLDTSFSSHVHQETLPDGHEWTIDVGQANAALFRDTLTGMFRQVATVNGTAAGSVDAVLYPSVEDYQFSTPEQSRTDYYEAWIKYQIRLYSPAGKLVADWPITAYGRSPSQFLGSGDSLRQATVIAMRDAAAAMVLQFERQPEVRAFFYGESNERSASL